MFNLELLAYTAQIKGHEVAQMLEGNVSAQLEFEGDRTIAITAGKLPHLDHQIPCFRSGVDQFTPH